MALAGTALAFAESTDEEVERWLRPLRLYGEAGVVLQHLAIGEARLVTAERGLQRASASRPDDTVATVTSAAAEHATERGATMIGTIDVLVAVMHHYRDAFDRALESRGSDRWELVEALACSLNAPLREG